MFSESPMTVEISLACELNDRTSRLYDGRISPEGIDLTVVPLEAEELFFRFSRFQDFDVSEMSMSSYMIAKDRGIDITAFPAFPSRAFRHGQIYIHTNSGIEKPEELKGKRVGIPEYQMTATLWQRAILQHEYGVAPSDVTWIKSGLENAEREERFDLDLPSDVEIVVDSSYKSLNAMIRDGDIDAMLTARTPDSFHDSDSVDRLFPDYVSTEKDYFKRTGHFPIMHTMAMRGDVYEDDPWVALELYKAFEQAKNEAIADLVDTTEWAVALPWLQSELASTQETLGDDYWPYGVDANRNTLEAMTEYSHEQGLSSRKHDVNSLFAANTISISQI